MRLYYDAKKAKDDDNIGKFQELCDLYCTEPNFDLCDVNDIGNQSPVQQKSLRLEAKKPSNFDKNEKRSALTEKE